MPGTFQFHIVYTQPGSTFKASSHILQEILFGFQWPPDLILHLFKPPVFILENGDYFVDDGNDASFFLEASPTPSSGGREWCDE